MKNDDVMSQARFIFTTGKTIQDHIFRIKAAVMDGKNNFGHLSVAQFNALMLIRAREKVSMTELSGLLGVSPPSASAMVDRLVEKGVLQRESCERDRRKVVVTISPQASEHIRKIEDNIFKTFVNLVERLGPESAAKWCEVLEQVHAILKEDM